MVPQIIINPQITNRLEQINQILTQSGLSQNHPNMLWIDDDKPGIAQARKIIEHLTLKPYQDKSQAVVVMFADNLSEDAQNALLKTLEEPPDSAIIILGASSEDNLLPTVLSRCHVMNYESRDANSKLNQQDREEIEKLQASSLEKRFQLIEKLENKEEFLGKLIWYFREQLNTNHSPSTVNYLNELIETERWTKQNVNLRAILEYIMLRLPK